MEGRDIYVYVFFEFLDIFFLKKKDEKEKSGRWGRRKKWDFYFFYVFMCLNIIYVDIKKILV